MLDETTLTGSLTSEYIFFGGKRVARRDSSGNIYYYAEDFIGSSRVITQANGTVCSDSDFLPFGQEVDFTSACGQNYKFEGKERDIETGNDNFGARFYRSALGRWQSPDWSAVPAAVPYANLTNPGTLNLYAMVSDNPETFADLNGHLGGILEPIATNPDGLSPDIVTGENYEIIGYGYMELGSAPPDPVPQQPPAPPQSPAEVQQQKIANAAINTVGSTEYLVSKANGNYAAGTDKCNEAVAGMVQASGAPRPQVPYTGWKGWLSRLFGLTRDPSSHEWADPKVKIPGWTQPLPLSHARPGAAIAQQHGSGGHVGIVVGPGQTVSASTKVNPPGLVVPSQWGFRPAPANGEGPHDPAPVVRLYIGDH